MKRYCRHPLRTARHEAAKLRKADRAERSTMTQLAIIEKRPGQSKRERARLVRELTTKA